MNGMVTPTSVDGIELALTVDGDGPPVVLVSGALDAGEETRSLAEALRDRFRTVVYSRRGRGSSGDRAGSTVADEIADLVAVIQTVGAEAAVVGISSGGVLALRAAAQGAPISVLALYEVPFDVEPGAAERAAAYTRRLEQLIGDADVDAALGLAMQSWGSPPEVIEQAKNSPFWEPLRKVAPTLVYDANVMGDNTVPVDQLANVTIPTLVVTSGGVGAEMAELDSSYFARAGDATANPLSNSTRVTLEVAGHQLDPHALGPVIEEFLVAHS
jgi:pimeloyl-ACP methyl ester carboxylesterase